MLFSILGEMAKKFMLFAACVCVFFQCKLAMKKINNTISILT